jgi:hypothetical protein
VIASCSSFRYSRGEEKVCNVKSMLKSRNSIALYMLLKPHADGRMPEDNMRN